MFRKSNFKRFCSLFVAVAILCGTFVFNPQPVMAASDVYVGGAGALDTNPGTQAAPVATLEVALDKIVPNTTGTIHVLGNINANVISTVPPMGQQPATVPTTITDLTIQSDNGNFKITGYLDISAPLELTLKDVWLFGKFQWQALFPAINITATAPTTINMDNSTVEAQWVFGSGGALMSGIRTASPLKVTGDGLIKGGGANVGAGIEASADVDISGPAAPDTLKIYGGDGCDITPPFNSASEGISMSSGADVTLKGQLDIQGGDGASNSGSTDEGGCAIFCGPGSDITITDPASYITVKGGPGEAGSPAIDSQGQIIFQDIPAEFYAEGGVSRNTPLNQDAAIKILGGNANIIYQPTSFGDNMVTDGHLEYKTRPVAGGYSEGDPTYTLVNSQFTSTQPATINMPSIPGVTNVSLTVPPHIATDSSFTGDIQYQWEKSTDGGATWTIINPDTDTDGPTGADTDTDGQDTATLPTFIPAVADLGDLYRCGVGNHIYTPMWSLRTPEPSPINVTIDYETEELIGFQPGNHTINTSALVTPDGFGKTPINDATTHWITTTISIVKNGNGTTTSDSAPFSLYLSPRPAAPIVSATNETSQGAGDGTITGVTSVMEWRPVGGTWTQQGAGSTITGLSPGNYEVRIKASNPNANFYGWTSTVTISNGPTRTLNVTAPIFATVIEGYTIQPAPQPIIISNSGNANATISNVAVSNVNGVNAFAIGGSGPTVTSGSSINTWTIQPAPGLAPGTYSETITVTYDNGFTATANVIFTVRATYIATAVSSPVAGGTTTIAASGSPGASITELPGTTATINAVPATGYTFSHWVVSDPNVILANSATTASNSFTMPSADITVTAYYNEIPNSITVNASPAIAGNATVTVGNVTGTTGMSVSNVPIIIDATPNYGYQFDHWTLNGSPITLNDPTTEANNSFNMPDANVSLTAVFVRAIPYNITLTTNIAGAGTPIATTSSSIAATTAIVTDIVNIDALPASGYYFHGWTVVNPSGLTLANPATQITLFTMPASNVEIMANYGLNPIPIPPVVTTGGNGNGNEDEGDGDGGSIPNPVTTPAPTVKPTATAKPTKPTAKPSPEPIEITDEVPLGVAGEEIITDGVPLGATGELTELNPNSEIFMKIPNKVKVTHGEYVDYTLSGIGNPYSAVVQDYSIGDNPPEGLTFIEGYIPAFTNGEGLTYSILYETNNQGVKTLYEDLDATEEFTFKAPELEKGEYITGIYLFFDEVPVDFAYGNTITYTFQVTETEVGTKLHNKGFVSFKLFDLEMIIPNEGNSTVTVYDNMGNKPNPNTEDIRNSHLLLAAIGFAGASALVIASKRKKIG